MLKFPWNSDKLFDIVFMFVMSLSFGLGPFQQPGAIPLFMEYNYRAWDYGLIIFVKDLNLSDNQSGHQICINNEFPLYLNGASSLAMLNGNCVDV